MRLYYKALAADGKSTFGFVEAKDASEAARYLRAHKVYPIKISEQQEKTLASYLPVRKTIKRADVLFFTRQLSSLLQSGLNLMQSLKVIGNQVENKAMVDMIQSIITDVEGGFPLSSAIEKFPTVFSPVYISLIKASESSGILDKVLLRMADNLEKEAKLKAQLKSALTYPAIVIALMVVVVFIMMIFVIPQLNTLYESLNVELPFTTQLLILISDITVRLWYMVFAIGILMVILLRRWYKSTTGKFLADGFIFGIPIFGRLLHFSMLTEFTRTLSMMIESGSLVVKSLEQASKVVGNVVFERSIIKVSEQVSKGVPMGDAMSASPLYPAVLVELVKIGEQTGKLDDSLYKASEYFERETESTIKKLTTALEPLIILVLGIGIAFLLFSVITPIYQITSSF